MKHIHIETGSVTSAAMDKTVTVRLTWRVKHPLYRKYITRHKKVHVHDENNAAKVNDIVRIQECRPLSKTKSWRLVDIVRSQV